MKVLSEMLASSKELELLCPGEALDKASTLPGTLTAGNKSEDWRASCQPEQVRHQAGGLQNSKTQEYQKRVCFVFHSKAEQMFAVFLVVVILKLWVERSIHEAQVRAHLNSETQDEEARLRVLVKPLSPPLHSLSEETHRLESLRIKFIWKKKTFCFQVQPF